MSDDPNRLQAQPVPPDSISESSHEGYEKRDVNARWVFGILGIVFVCGLSIHFILAGLLAALKDTNPPKDRWQMVKTGARPAVSNAPFPRLQVSPPLDLKKFRQREEAELNTYGWVNRTAGVVRLPIQRAITLVLREGLPARSQTNQSQTGPSAYQLMQKRASGEPVESETSGRAGGLKP